MVSANRRSVDERRTPASRAIVEAVADAEGVEPSAVTPPAYDPLYAVVDPDALDSLVGAAAARGTEDLRVVFPYEGYEVVVRADGHTAVAPSPENDGDTPLGE